jgi:hypothetical protein
MVRSRLSIISPTLVRHQGQLTDVILNDPILLRRLNERVYELLLSDTRQLRDRHHGGQR